MKEKREQQQQQQQQHFFDCKWKHLFEEAESSRPKTVIYLFRGSARRLPSQLRRPVSCANPEYCAKQAKKRSWAACCRLDYRAINIRHTLLSFGREIAANNPPCTSCCFSKSACERVSVDNFFFKDEKKSFFPVLSETKQMLRKKTVPYE